MRLFILLAAAAVAVLNALSPNKIQLDKFEDGTLITFWFKHFHNPTITDDKEKDEQSVAINFYKTPHLNDPFDPSDANRKDLLVHLRLRIDGTEPVVSNYAEKNGKWSSNQDKQPDGTRTALWTPLNEKPAISGYWRVDVYKHDKNKLSVFFHGFWSQVRQFSLDDARKLDDVKSIYLLSDSVDPDSVQIYVKTPNKNVPVIGWDRIDLVLTASDKSFCQPETKPCPFIKFPNFPKGDNIEMVTVLKASGYSKKWKPALRFSSSKDDGSFFLRILQILEPGKTSTQELWFNTDDDDGSARSGHHCRGDYAVPFGDLQHIFMARTGDKEFTVRVFFKASVDNELNADHEGYECKWTESDPTRGLALEQGFANPFYIHSDQGAMILHLESSMKKLDM